jgi:hypothetical protein
MEIHKAAKLTSKMFLDHFYNADETGLFYLSMLVPYVTNMQLGLVQRKQWIM